MDWLKVEGDRLVGGGNTVTLRGYNVGGWMNMENFLSGYPSSESNFRAAMLKALGPERYKVFFDAYMEAFFNDADCAYLASLGTNAIRIPFNYRHFESDAEPFRIKPEGLRLLDRAIAQCKTNGLYAVLDMHSVPGSQNQHWHSDNSSHIAHFWQQRQFQDRAIWLWEVLAERYKDEPAVAGYNVLNEPGDESNEIVGPFYDRAVAAIRAIDPRHVIFLDGNRYATDFSAFKTIHENTVYAAHDYKLPGFADGGPYPGISRGVYVDRAHVEETFLKRTEFMRETGTPIWIAEFGPIYPAASGNLEERYQLMRDQLEIYNAHGASWSIWAYKDMGEQALVSVVSQSPWRRLMQPLLDKKARLGAEGWGAIDRGIGNVIEPVKGLVKTEYPDFDPYPFGVDDWIATLFRSIMLAEPLLDEVKRLVAPLEEAALVQLAGSFRFEACAIRKPLEAIVSEAARA
ncbi:MAG: cellulase family glycosylhydrolase [Devosia sp.]